MNMKEIKEMSNEALLMLYAEKVRCDHYDPFETSEKMQALYDANITQENLENEILSRMNAVQHMNALIERF